MSDFRHGTCQDCGCIGWMKDGKCAKCNEKVALPDIFKDIFHGES